METNKLLKYPKKAVSYINKEYFFIKETNFILSATNVADIPTLGLPEIAFFGRSNVGKSSLINALANNKKLSKVSRTPGRTSQINIFSAKIVKKNNENKNCKSFLIVDLPGIGYAKVSKTELARYSKIISNYISKSKSLTTIFHLFDIRRNFNEKDLSFKTKIKKYIENYFLILTKTDKLSKNKNLLELNKKAKSLNINKENFIMNSNIKNIGLHKIFNCIWNSL